MGEQDIVELSVGADSTPPELLRALNGVAGVSGASRENGTLRLLARDGNAALPELIALANTHGTRVTNVNIREPNLEAVFLQPDRAGVARLGKISQRMETDGGKDDG